jgi:hypothetical protein
MVLAIAGCAGAPGATQSSAGGTANPGAATPAITPAATPAVTNPPVGGGNECASFPTFSVTASAQPSFAGDPQLDAFWPAQIDGQPVTEIQSASWLETICIYGGQAQVDKLKQTSAGGALLTNMTFGSAHASIGGTDVQISALRVPGSDANTIVQNVSLFVAGLTGNTPEPFTTTQANIGGKQAYVLVDSEGKTTYAYPKGDTLVTLDDVDQTQAATIFAALP